MLDNKKTIHEKLVSSIVIPSEHWDKIEKTERVLDNEMLDLLDFLTNKESRFSIMYGNQDLRFSELVGDEVKEYTKEEFLKLFNNR
jgi:hypothetical protein